ncbi:MAG: DUF4097 family beta strand repeat protein [candidate division Zixibacteria bacterium]|nr:DUF4097 family beta strand repeat protein [candidate division Zixibacteria bacterium]
MRKSLLITALIGIILVQLPCRLIADDFRFEYQRVIKTGPEAVLNLEFVHGDVTILSSEQEKIIIDATKQLSAVNGDEAQMVADHIEIKVEHDGNRVDVTTNYLRMHNRSQSFWSKLLGRGGEDSFGDVNWTIQVPHGCKISIVNSSGAINVDNIIGSVAIRGSAIDVKLTNIEGDVAVECSKGKLELTGIEGSVNVENSSGTTVGELLFGDVTVRQAQGKVDLKFIEGDIKVKSTSASISIRQDRGSLDLSTSTGRVDIYTGLDSPRDYYVSTESGDIKLSIPETSSGNLRIESQTGDIKTEMPIAIKSMTRKQVEGSFGSGGVKINLTSISGDVTVAQF